MAAESWNPISGCTKISPGCTHCYAERMARRLAGRCGYPAAPHHFDVTLHPKHLEQPLRWRKPRRIFVCSMSDLFHEDVPEEYIDAVFAVMAAAERHTFQVLTKRPRRMARYFQELGERSMAYPAPGRRSVSYAEGRVGELWRNHFFHAAAKNDFLPYIDRKLPLSSVWLGVTVENQETADARRADLEAIPAAVKFASYEPALGAVDWTGWEFVDQIIGGGESGPGARPSHPDWHRATRDFCQEHGIAYFFKQVGEYLAVDDAISAGHITTYERNHAPHVYLPDCAMPFVRVGKKRAGRQLDGREWNEYPQGGDHETL